jgi:hypothetical protein
MPASDHLQIAQNASDIAALKGANTRFPTDSELPETLTQAEVEAIFETESGGKTPTDGDTLISFNQDTFNYTWSYFGVDAVWKYRGIDAVGIATQTELGIVKGENTSGKIYVETDGTMSLVGYDTINSSISDLNSNLSNKVDKTGAGYKTYITDSAGNQGTQSYSQSNNADTFAVRYDSGRLKVGTPVDDNDAVTKVYADNIASAGGSFVTKNGTSVVTSFVLDGDVGIDGYLDVNSNKIINVANPTDSGDAANKAYVDANDVQSDWEETDSTALDYIKNKPNLSTVATSGSYTDLTNKPSIPAAQVNSDWNASSGISEILNKPALSTVATSGSYTDLSDKPVIPDVQIQSDWDQSDSTKLDYINNKPALSIVATSGDYDDLSNKPTIPSAQVNSDWDSTGGVSEILNKPALFSGDYEDLSNKPTIPDAQIQSDWDQSDSTKLDYINNKPALSTVATSGSYTDLSNKPTIPAAQVNSDWNASSGISEILNKPTIPTLTSELTNNSNFVVDSAYVHTDVNFTTTLRTKLNGIATGAEVNVQSNWSETNSTSDAFIVNKPTIPTNTSELTNDSNFVVDASYVHTDNNLTNAIVNQANYYNTTRTATSLASLALNNAVIYYKTNTNQTLSLGTIDKANFNYMIVCVCNATITIPATSGTVINMSGETAFTVTTAKPVIFHVLNGGGYTLINVEESK